MDNNTPSVSDLELLTKLLREEIEAEGGMSRTEIGFLFDDIYVRSVENGTATVAVPNLYMREYFLRNHVDKKLAKHLSHLLGKDLDVFIFVDETIYPTPEMQVFGYLNMHEEQIAKQKGMTVEEYRAYRREQMGITPEGLPNNEQSAFRPPHEYAGSNSAGSARSNDNADGGIAGDSYASGDGYDNYDSGTSENRIDMTGDDFKIGFLRSVTDENGVTHRRIVSAEQIAAAAASEPVSYKEDYTFESFVVGDSNKVAHAFALFVAEHPGDRGHNPLYIYGPPGVGKTHLMYAISNRILKDDPSKRIEYIKGEDFVNLFVEMIHAGRAVEFREKYRGTDVLIVDDVQFIAGKEATEEELFHTFNSLFEDNKQIVFTADKLPREMSGISKRFESRLEGGVMADIQLPEYELRLAILRNKAQSSGLNLTEEVEDFLVKRLTSSVRQIEGVIKKLSGLNFVSDEALTVDSVRKSVPEYLSDSVPTEDIVKNVIAACAEYYSVKPEDVLGERRDKDIQQARNAAMYIIRKITTLSTLKIGEIFGRKHTTVIANCKTIMAEIEKKPSFASEIEQMIRNSRT